MASRQSAYISLAAVHALAPGGVINDTKIKGFMARRQKDAVSYVLKTRVAGRQRFYTIGRHGQPWTPDAARKRALAILADPSIAEKKVVPPAVTSFAAFADQFLALHGPKLKRRTLEEYQCLVRLYLIPAFGTKPLDTLTRAHISNAHAGWKDAPRAANHALAVLSKMLSWAEDQGYRPEDSNPCRRIQRYKENKRQTFLQADEMDRLGAALDKAAAENLVGPFALAALRLLILTGARLNEILTLEWAHVDLGRRMIFLADSKTGQKPIVLNDAAVSVLESLPRFANNPYVIVGNRHGTHLVNLQRPWQTVRALAGLETVRIHDLRHTYASYAVASGGSLPIIGKILGHSQPQTTQRYSHLADDPVKQLSQLTGQKLADAMKRKPA